MKPLIAADFETHRIKRGMPAPRAVCMSEAEYDGETVHTELMAREEALDRFEWLIQNARTLWHNAPFDLTVGAAERPRILPAIFDALDRGDVEDTMIRSKIIDNAKGTLKYEWNEEDNKWVSKGAAFSLGALLYRYYGKDIADEKKGENAVRLRYHEMEGRRVEDYPEDFQKYAISDPVHTLMVRDAQEEETGGDEIPGLVSSMQAHFALHLTSTWGCRTDPEAVRSFKAEVAEKYARQVEICQEWGLRRDNAEQSRNMAKVTELVEKCLRDKEQRIELTKTGRIATTRDQLMECDHPGLTAVAESVRLGKLLTTYVPALERGVEWPLNPHYNPILETFRTSCSGGRKLQDGAPPGLNIQNCPRDGKVRECFVPRPGWVLAFCDYDTLEMLTLAQTCIDLFGFSTIADAAREGEDFHLSMAADMLQIPYRDALVRYEAGDADIKNARQGCKVSNYGYAGGMGPDSFVSYAKSGYGIEVSRSHAVKLHKQFRSKWRETVDYFNYASFLCEGGRAEFIVHPRTGMIRGNVSYSQLLNFGFQHLAAVGAKEALYEVVRECYVDGGSPLYGCRPWAFLHDEIGIEIPYDAIGPERAHAAALRLQEIMVERMQRWCPDVPIKASVAMVRRWLKGAKAVFQNNIMVPSKLEGKKWVADL